MAHLAEDQRLRVLARSLSWWSNRFPHSRPDGLTPVCFQGTNLVLASLL